MTADNPHYDKSDTRTSHDKWRDSRNTELAYGKPKAPVEADQVPDCKASVKDPYGHKWLCLGEWGHEGLHYAVVPWATRVGKPDGSCVTWDDRGTQWR